MSKMDSWFRKHDPRRQNAERKKTLETVESIFQRQESGQITKEQASLEFGLTASWDPDLMLFPKPGSTLTNKIPSNTGIYARGPKRGWLFTKPGEQPDCLPEILEHFKPGNKGWINGPPAVERTPSTEATPPTEAKP